MITAARLLKSIEEIGTPGKMWIMRFFIGTPYEVKVMRVNAETDCYTLHLPFVHWPIKEDNAKDCMQWVVDVYRRAHRDGNYVSFPGSI